MSTRPAVPVPRRPPDAADPSTLDPWLDYHGRIARAMTAERTALGSALIPVSAYILVSAVEAYLRYPEMLRAIASARSPEMIGAAGRSVGNQVDAVHLWSLANIPLLGRQILRAGGLVAPEEDAVATGEILAFWHAAAIAFRSDGHVQAWEANGVVSRYRRDTLDELLALARPVPRDAAIEATRLCASLASYLFLLYFDTRAGYQDTGPYPAGEGRVALVRDLHDLGPSPFPWSDGLGGRAPGGELVAVFVLDGAAATVDDWGTSRVDPADIAASLVAFGMARSDDGRITPIGASEQADWSAWVKGARRELYRRIAGMSREQKIVAGAYVYFTFLRPFARAAGVEDAMDWTCPRDAPLVADGLLYSMLSAIDETPPVQADDPTPYYDLFGTDARG